MKLSYPNFLYVGSIILFIGLVGSQISPEYGFSRLARFGETWEPVRIQAFQDLSYPVFEDSAGYDGQFYAQLATDPTLQKEEFVTAIDSPSMRSRRILLPTLAYVLGFGQPGWILQVYASLNLIFWFLLAALVKEFLPEDPSHWRQFSRWFGILFNLGALEGVRLALLDLPSLVFILLAIRAWKKNREKTGSGWALAALFTRETSILAMAGFPKLESFQKKPWLRGLASGFLLLGLYSVWLFYIHMRFIPHAGTSGNIDWPFSALLSSTQTALQALAEGRWDTPRYYGGVLAAVGFSFQCFYLLAKWDWKNPLWRVGMLYGLLVIMLGIEPWKGIWAPARVGLPLTFVFNCYLPKNRWFYPCWWLGNGMFLIGFIRFLWN